MRRAYLAFVLGIVSVFVVCPASVRAQSILFDATKGQMLGNADWVIDADVFNLGPARTTRRPEVGRGNESNPQQTPTAAAAGITASTPETYWRGGLSAWGVASVQRGLGVQTLPFNRAITYNVASNPQDLKRYKVFVIPEPQFRFTATEKTAILNFVRNGGGLFIIGNHARSDRNSDGVDAVVAWNDLFDTNTAGVNPFGIRFNAVDISTTSSQVLTTANPITRGVAGAVARYKTNGGATITIDPARNASVRAAVWQTSSRTNARVLVAYATYGSGRVVAIADSSAVDDGTGDNNDTLFNGWSSFDNRRLVMNATLWLAGR